MNITTNDTPQHPNVGSKRPQREERRKLFDATADPRRIVFVIREAVKLGRSETEIHDFIRNSLRIARRQGRMEAGRK